MNARIPDASDNGDPGPLEPGSGVLEMHPNGYGFLRDPKNNYDRELTDPFVPGSMIDKFALREGVCIQGMIQPGRRQQGPRLREIIDVDGMKPEEYRNVKNFDQLTAINPESWLRLEVGPEPMTTRVMDLLTPLGKGQRALIVAPYPHVSLVRQKRGSKCLIFNDEKEAMSDTSAGPPATARESRSPSGGRTFPRRAFLAPPACRCRRIGPTVRSNCKDLLDASQPLARTAQRR
ncbi:MAG: hypothetical protein WCI75_20890 [candidate division NC10 bacterium]